MLKHLTNVALAATWLLVTALTAGAASGTTAKAADNPSTTQSKLTTTHSRPIHHRTTAHNLSRLARSRHLWDPASYGDPTALDDPVGEDPAIRQAAIAALGNWNGSVVVVDPNTGRILSMVNQKLALSSGFTPCSTFKPVIALAALREGLITPTTKLYVDGRERINVTEALAHSNNLFFHRLGEMLGFDRITQYAQEFGLGEKAGLDIPGESAGSYPSVPPKEGGVGHLAYCGTGIEITALQMAAIISAIANGGTLYALQYPRAAEEVAAFQPVVRRRVEELAPYIPQIRDGLAGSVLYGTGHSAYHSDLSIYGKTGTCSENGTHLGWFASYGGDPLHVVVVLLRGGRMMFGPHAAEIAGRVYGGLAASEPSLQANRDYPFTLHSTR